MSDKPQNYYVLTVPTLCRDYITFADSVNARITAENIDLALDEVLPREKRGESCVLRLDNAGDVWCRPRPEHAEGLMKEAVDSLKKALLISKEDLEFAILHSKHDMAGTRPGAVVDMQSHLFWDCVCCYLQETGNTVTWRIARFAACQHGLHKIERWE